MRKLVIMIFISVLYSQGSGINLKVGYCGHDHIAALFVAAQQPERTKADIGLYLKELVPKTKYQILDNEKALASVELILSDGGEEVPQMIEQGKYDVCLGGIQNAVFFRDRGADVKIISPLHTKGGMLVVHPENPVNKWYKLVTWIKGTDRQVKIGYKEESSFARLIIEHALKEKKISVTFDSLQTESRVLLVDLKSEEILNDALDKKIIDAYVAENPGCTVTHFTGKGKIIADLNNLPPFTWKDYPCCCIAATESALKNKKDAVKEFMKLIILATNYLGSEDDSPVKNVADWVGESVQVENVSMSNYEYSTKPTEYWKDNLLNWVKEMEKEGKIVNRLKDASRDKICSELLNLEILTEAFNDLINVGYMTWY